MRVIAGLRFFLEAIAGAIPGAAQSLSSSTS
jgi:hypothetical protein